MLPLFGTFSMLVSFVEGLQRAIASAIDGAPWPIKLVGAAALGVYGLAVLAHGTVAVAAFVAANAIAIAFLCIGGGVFLASVAVSYAIIRGDLRVRPR